MDPRLDGKDPEMNRPAGQDSEFEPKRGGTWKTWALLTLPLLFLAVFFYLPIFNTFKLAFTNAHGQPISNEDLVGIWEPLIFTFYQAALSTILTLIIGIPAAFLFSRFFFAGKRILRSLVMVPFILPTVVVAAGFNALLGPRGWLNLALMSIFDLKTPPIDLLYSLAAILLAHVFYNTSVIIRMVGSAWSRLDIRLEQTGRVLGATAWRNFVEVTFPLLRPSILSAILVVFLFDFTSFGVILLLGGPQYATLEVDIYIQSMQLLNFPMAAILSVIQMLCTLIIIVIISRISGETIIPLAPRLREEGMKTAVLIKEKVFVFCMAFALFLVFLTPLLALALRSITRLEFDPNLGSTVKTTLTTAYYQELFINRRGSIFFVPPIDAIRNSLVFAGLVVLISSSLGMLISAALERRSRGGKGAEILTTLPLGTSAVSLGLGLLLLFNGFKGELRLHCCWCRSPTVWWRCLSLSAPYSQLLLPSRSTSSNPRRYWELQRTASGAKSPCRSSGGRSWRERFLRSRSRSGSLGQPLSWQDQSSRRCRSPFRAFLPCPGR